MSVPTDRPKRQRAARGGGWVAGQVVLIAAILLSAVVGPGVPDGFAIIAYAAGGALILLGAVLLISGGAGLGSALTPFPAPRPEGQLVTVGVYRWVRHPMYGGGILVALGWSVLTGSVVGLILTVALALYFELKSRREERWLVDRYAGYAEYRRQTPRKFVPFVH
jgi:protein-S-isoprenylcysteine O-methyltransferase Ste14